MLADMFKQAVGRAGGGGDHDSCFDGQLYNKMVSVADYYTP